MAHLSTFDIFVAYKIQMIFNELIFNAQTLNCLQL